MLDRIVDTILTTMMVLGVAVIISIPIWLFTDNEDQPIEVEHSQEIEKKLLRMTKELEELRELLRKQALDQAVSE